MDNDIDLKPGDLLVILWAISLPCGLQELLSQTLLRDQSLLAYRIESVVLAGWCLAGLYKVWQQLGFDGARPLWRVSTWLKYNLLVTFWPLWSQQRSYH